MADIKEKAKSFAEYGADKAKHAQEKASGVVDAVKEKAADIYDTMKEGARSAMEKTGEFASEASERAQQFASDTCAATADTVKNFGNDVSKLVRDYPIAAIMVGFGVGMLLGRSLRS